MIGATRATWGHVIPMTLILRAREADKGVLVAPRGPNLPKMAVFWDSSEALGATLGPRLSPDWTVCGN